MDWWSDSSFTCTLMSFPSWDASSIQDNMFHPMKRRFRSLDGHFGSIYRQFCWWVDDLVQWIDNFIWHVFTARSRSTTTTNIRRRKGLCHCCGTITAAISAVFGSAEPFRQGELLRHDRPLSHFHIIKTNIRELIYCTYIHTSCTHSVLFITIPGRTAS